MKIYLIRHGDPDYATDSLTSLGKSEAEHLAEYLSTIRIDRLFSSPLGRARETAAYSEARLGKQAEILDWTAELGMGSNDGNRGAAWNMLPQNLRNPDYQDHDAWNEVLQEMASASDNWLEALGWKRNGYQYEFLPGKRCPKDLQLALFCHGGFGLTWLGHLLQIPHCIMWSSFFLHTSSVTTILFDERIPSIATPRVISLSALPHLYKSDMVPNTAGIVANYI